MKEEKVTNQQTACKLCKISLTQQTETLKHCWARVADGGPSLQHHYPASLVFVGCRVIVLDKQSHGINENVNHTTRESTPDVRF